MRVLFDNGTPRGVGAALTDHIVEEARAHGWDTLRNGELLDAAEAAGFDVLLHDRRRVAHVNVTAHPTAAWTAQQLREAWPWDTAPRFVIRDRDGIYGSEFQTAMQAMGIEEVVIAPRAPWQNPFVERVIGSLRRAIWSFFPGRWSFW